MLTWESQPQQSERCRVWPDHFRLGGERDETLSLDPGVRGKGERIGQMKGTKMGQMKDDILDASRPNPGRIYDYLLGGRHNFEIDREAARRVIELMPFAPKAARLQRWCLRDLAEELTQQRGFDVIIDFASGLPTNDHIHFQVPKGTVVIYSDWDQVTVEYAHDILGDTPDVYYLEADARYPEKLLDCPEVEKILKGRRNIALIYWGVSSFLADDDIVHAAQVLYEWTGPKGCWVFNAQVADMDDSDPARRQIYEVYRRMGTLTYVRSLDQYRQLIQPWQTDERRFIPLLEWHGFNPAELEMRLEERQLWGPGGGGYGAFLVK
jgi:hypothetical protein